MAFNQYGQTLMFEGLGTFTLLTAPFAGLFTFDGKISLPTLSTGGGVSAVVAIVKQGATTKYTGTAGNQGFEIQIECAAADVITLVLSSAAAPDQPINTIKTTVAVSYAQP